MKKPTKPTKTKTAIAANLKVSRSTLYSWEAAGCPVDKGEAAVIEWALAENKKGNDTDEMKAAKIAVLRGHERRLKLANDRHAATVMLRADAAREAGQAMQTVFAALEIAFSYDLPPALVGATLPEITNRLTAQLRKLQAVIRLEFGKMAGEKITSNDFKAAALSADAIAVLQFASRRAWDAKLHAEWQTFTEWKRADEAARGEQRRAWCIKRAAAGLPVPDASDIELAEVKGLSRA